MIPAVGPQRNTIDNNSGFYTTPELEKELRESRDHVVSGSLINRTFILGDQFQNALTVYPAKGLAGSVNSNFYEFLTMGMVPYVIGSGTLMAVFNLASKYFEPFQKSRASIIGHKMALGVLFYGVFKSLSRSLIETPVYWKTGINVNKPYKTTKTELPENYKRNKNGDEPEGRKSIEYHKVFESVDFPRWDLLYDLKEGKHRNYYYDKIAKKLGCEPKLVDSDQEVKPLIRETVIRTKTFTTLSSYIWAGLGVAIAAQDKWNNAFTKNNGKVKIFSAEFLKRFVKTFREACKQLWQGGTYKAKGLAIAGKTFVIAAIASSVIGAVLSMYDFFGKRADLLKGKIDFDDDYTVG